MPYAIDLGINLAAAFIVFLLGFAANQAWRWYRLSKPLEHLWSLSTDTNNHVSVQVIVATLIEKVNGYDRYGTGMGEAKAYAAVRESLLDAYGDTLRLKFDFSRDFASNSRILFDDEEPHIISLGGPKYNSTAKRLHAHFSDLPLYVDHVNGEPDAIVDRRLNIRYQPKLDDNKNPLEDYGLISRLPSDGGNRKVVVYLIEGVRTYGVAAAGQLFVPPLVKELQLLVKQAPRGYWQALVRIQVDGVSSTPVLIKESFVALDSQGRPSAKPQLQE